MDNHFFTEFGGHNSKSIGQWGEDILLGGFPQRLKEGGFADQGNAAAYNNICAAHNRMQAWDQSISACERALALDPESDLIKNNLRWARAEKAKN